MISRFRLSAREFSALAAGYGGGDAVNLLQSAQLSKQLLLIRAFAKADPSALAELEPAMSVLAQAQRRAPAAVSYLLSDPWVGAWTAHCARRLYRPPSPRAGERRGYDPAGEGERQKYGPLWAELAHLRAIAAAAAIRTGIDADLMLCARDGRVTLPTLGSARVDVPDQALVHVQVRGGRAIIRGGGSPDKVPRGTDDDRWQNLRKLDTTSGGLRLQVTLDDLDPHRDCYGMAVADRIPAEQVADWRSLLTDAWQLLVRYSRVRAEELAVGLRTLVPLAPTLGGTAVARSSEGERPTYSSATTPDAFGALVLAKPGSGAELAATLVHEFQHSKLGGLVDLVPLHDGSTEARFFAPWRREPRSIGSLLHGTYAFLGVADLWRRMRAARAAWEGAEQEFANLREQVRHGLHTLAASAALTPSGQRFVEGMRTTVTSLMAEPLPADIVERARRALRRNEIAWRLRNLRAEPAEVAGLAAAFVADALTADQAPAPATAAGTAAASDEPFVRAADTDEALVRAAETVGGVLASRPELVRAVRQELATRTGKPPELVTLAAWLTAATSRAPAGPGTGRTGAPA